MGLLVEDEIINTIRKRLFTSDYEFYGFEKYEKRIVPLIKNTYVNGVSNSLVITGKKSSGKTHLIKSVLKYLNKDDDFSKNMYQIHLNGWVHTDDKIALKSIAMQLKIHLSNDSDEELSCSDFNKEFEYMLSFLLSSEHKNISLLFIIEEFDYFLRHKNQNLIYNLLNAVQSREMPIFLLGTSASLDFDQLMEKRVISRFSQGKLNVTPFVKTFELYVDAVKKLLTVDIVGKESNKTLQKWNKSVEQFCEKAEALKILERCYFYSDTISLAKKILMLVVSKLSISNMKLSIDQLESSWRLISTDYRLETLKNLCLLEFTFLAALVNCVGAMDMDTNFDVVYKEYEAYCKDIRSTVYERNMLRKCLDHLLDLDLVDMGKTVNVNVAHRKLQSHVSREDLIECSKHRDIPTSLELYIFAKIKKSAL